MPPKIVHSVIQVVISRKYLLHLLYATYYLPEKLGLLEIS